MLPINQKIFIVIKGAGVPDQGMVKVEFDELVFYQESPYYRMHFTGLRNIDPILLAILLNFEILIALCARLLIVIFQK